MNPCELKKRVCLFVLLTAVLSACAGAGDRNDENQLNELLDAFLAGASVSDPDIHDRFWAEDLVYTSSSGARFGKAEIMAGLETSGETAASGPVYEARDTHIRVFGTTATLTFTLVASDPEGGVTRYYNSGFFQKREGQWQAIVWQATLATD